MIIHYIYFALSISIHELAHIIIAKIFNLKLKNLRVSIFGPSLELENTYKQLSAGEIEQTVVEIIGRFVDNPPTYQLRYVKTLKPIILVDLDQDYNELSIKGVQKKTECELPEECHQEILERAVTLAKIAYSGSTDTIARANQRQKRNND